jgi:hypothetical protein
MRSASRNARTLATVTLLWLGAAGAWASSSGPKEDEGKPRMDIYGFAMLDMGQDFKSVDPSWSDVLRPTKLPSYDKEFGEDNSFYAGVRQSRLGVKGFIPTKYGELKTIFEFELFGTGVDAGQTTFRLRHAWGELGAFGAGQTWSPFMDPDVFPNSVEYWGPNGMVFYRNVQVRWMPIRGGTNVAIALERPGASADQGVLSDRLELADVKGRFPMPDISGHLRFVGDWGHLQAAGIVRKIKWDDLGAGTPGHGLDLSGDVTGWGINLSTNLKLRGSDTLRASFVHGEGIENYMNDAPVDVGATIDPRNIGEALPVNGYVAFYDAVWNDHWSTTAGYSRVDIDNSNGQSPSAFKTGQYALFNVLCTPIPNLMLGPEFQWGRRENNSDGWSVDDYRVQFSVKYSFKQSIGG